jgi:hypothetical protein
MKRAKSRHLGVVVQLTYMHYKDGKERQKMNRKIISLQQKI